ncbi:hypothetical protein K402DRAFT_267460 [Aulographum hederae CBS 113979]|uniref:Uncharacterized protein n=1 Tax=Aulographum hederae CBS 113979 TaxID=1176131 RepID=A0A6G1GIT2_9PEZI|nr:hypothetical protein K402DRAFT_267460 [Aulographum hederae CBS 113979]
MNATATKSTTKQTSTHAMIPIPPCSIRCKSPNPAHTLSLPSIHPKAPPSPTFSLLIYLSSASPYYICNSTSRTTTSLREHSGQLDKANVRCPLKISAEMQHAGRIAVALQHDDRQRSIWRKSERRGVAVPSSAAPIGKSQLLGTWSVIPSKIQRSSNGECITTWMVVLVSRSLQASSNESKQVRRLPFCLPTSRALDLHLLPQKSLQPAPAAQMS